MALIGRETALAQVDRLLESLPSGGGALLLRGERGSGRSTVLQGIRRRADQSGYAVVSARGTAAEEDMPYAALHQLLWPLRGAMDDLPGPWRRSLEAALSPRTAGEVDRFQAGVAVLELLVAAAAQRPLVVLIDDAHRVDAGSLDIFAFVGRRMASAQIAIIAALDTGGSNALAEARLPELVLPRLDQPDAVELMAQEVGELDDRLRRHVLELAAGHPLALVELGRAARDHQTPLLAQPVPDLPLSPRLVEAIADETELGSGAPGAVLLVAAVDPETSLDELIEVAGRVSAGPVDISDVSTAVGSGLVSIVDGCLVFRDELSRTAVLASAESIRVQAVRRALADIVDAGTRRGALHAAAVAGGPDEELAERLTAVARDLRRIGQPARAAATFEAAAGLSEDPHQRVQRLISASLSAVELGAPQAALRLLDQARRLPGDDGELAMIEWQRRVLREAWTMPDEQGVRLLTDAFASSSDPEAALTAFMPLALTCWWSDPEPGVRRTMHLAALRIGSVDDTRVAAISALADPDEAAPLIAERLTRVTGADITNPLESFYLAVAAQSVGAWHEAHRLLGPAVGQIRRRGHSGALANALTFQAFGALHTGDWSFCREVAEEAHALALEVSRERLALSNLLCIARSATLGSADDDEVHELLGRATEAAWISGLSAADANIRSARVNLASAEGRWDQVYDELLPLFVRDRGTPHPMVRSGWQIFDLVEACHALGRPAEAARLLADFQGGSVRLPRTLVASAVACARPLTVLDEAAEQQFRGALELDLSPSPFLRARLLLAYGRWLARQRRTSEAVPMLRTARDELAMVGAIRFVEATRRELRAAGDGPQLVTAPVSLEALTAHERRIAELAADGLTNSQIAELLQLSPRTISSHLYRIYPKLEVTSRTQLRDVLSRPEVTAP